VSDLPTYDFCGIRNVPTNSSTTFQRLSKKFFSTIGMVKIISFPERNNPKCNNPECKNPESDNKSV
jgi:hypothetical protein